MPWRFDELAAPVSYARAEPVMVQTMLPDGESLAFTTPGEADSRLPDPDPRNPDQSNEQGEAVEQMCTQISRKSLCGSDSLVQF